MIGCRAPYGLGVPHPVIGHPSPQPPATVDLLEAVSGSTALSLLDRFRAPRWLFRTASCLILGGQVFARIFKGGPLPGRAGHSAGLRQAAVAQSQGPGFPHALFACASRPPARLPARQLSTVPPVHKVPTPFPPAGKIHLRNTRDQLTLVGPRSLGVALLTAGFVGMVFTIQVRGGVRGGLPSR